jgi:hypothetical protein
VPRKGKTMAASSRLMITEAERRSRCGLGWLCPLAASANGSNQIQAWLNENCGANGWATTPTGQRDGLGKLILRGDGEGAPVDARDDGSSTVGKALSCRLDRPSC